MARVTRSSAARIAIVDGSRTVTYRDLDHRSAVLAQLLTRKGVGAESAVVLLVDHGVHAVVSMVAVVRAGGAYVPLNKSFPIDRVRSLIEDSGAGVVLTDSEECRTALTGLPDHIAVVVLDENGRPLGAEPGEWTSDSAAYVADSASLAYVMYTSGSTGEPRGVAVSHRNVLSLARSEIVARPARPHFADRVLVHSPLAFDASTYEVWATLLRGGTAVLGPREGVSSEVLRGLIERSGLARAFLTTQLFTILAMDNPGVFRGMQQVMTGGEVVSPSVAIAVAESCPELELVHVYGPTETTTFAAWHVVGDRRSGPLPLSSPVDGFRLDLVDPATDGCGEPSTDGELLLSGPAVARGYSHRPALTAERFIPDPTGPPGTRRYRTGDRCRWAADDELEFVGRLDRQVKLRGFRIELGEIETALLSLSDVSAAVVVVREDRAGVRALAGYVVAADASRFDTAAALARLGEHLPDFMVPATLTALDSLPLTANGKIDQRRLPVPMVDHGPAAPAGTAEHVIAELFAEVLGVETVGAQVGFLDMGGNSLLAMRLVGQLRSRFGLRRRVQDLMRRPTVVEFVADMTDDERALLTASAVDAPSNTLVPASGPAGSRNRLSSAQQRLWFIDQLLPGRPDYNVPIAVRLVGELDRAALAAALSDVVVRHDILRTRYETSADEPWQVVEPSVPIGIEVVDACSTGAADPFGAADRVIEELWARPFDLRAAPPLRAHLLEVGDDTRILCLVLHHIATDGISNDIVIADLARCYSARSRGGELRSPAPRLRYSDYSLWQQSRVDTAEMREDVDFWRSVLAGSQAVGLPTDRTRPARPSGRGDQLDLPLPAVVQQAVAQLARRSGVTTFTVLLATFVLLVARQTGLRDIAVGTPVSGRTTPETEQLVGFLVNTVVLRADVDQRRSFSELLAGLREVTAAAFSHAELPFERVVEELHPERDLATHPLFQLMFSMSASGDAGQWADLRAEWHPVPFRAAKFDLELSVREDATGLVLVAFYAQELFEAASIARLLRRFTHLLAEVTATPERPLSEISMLDAAELAALDELQRAVSGESEVDDVTLHEAVTEQVRRAPDAVAVTAGEHSMSYRELDRCSDGFAAALADAGTVLRQPVGVWLDRGPDLLVALLGVLKAGGVFVPLDPGLPPERARVILAEAGARLCVTAGAEDSAAVCDVARPFAVPAVDVLRCRATAAPHAPQVDADDLVSIYYTSGSTGRPKGVANTHRGWVNRMRWMQSVHRLAPGESVLHKTVLSFDDSAVELFWPLMHGGRVVMLEPGAHRDPLAILQEVERSAVAVVQFVPSMLSLVCDEVEAREDPPPAALRRVVSSGDELRPELVARFTQTLGGTGATLHNQWGPTEASIDATWHPCVPEDADRGRVPIGTPLTNYRVHVLDENLNRVPPGVAGELFIGGVGVARGYWNDPIRTAVAFVPDPFLPGGVLYRTGDRGVLSPDGVLMFGGRTDHQVKIRGNRVELAEVERHITGHRDVAEAVVTVWECEAGDKRLVAHVRPEAGARPDVDDLRAALARRLPSYMVPSHMLLVELFPLTASGKVDRNALPAPVRSSAQAGRRPSSESELLVAEVWAEFLDASDADADFFALGGHSLLATQIVSRLRRVLDTDLPLIALFEHPTIAGLACAVEQQLLATAGSVR